MSGVAVLPGARACVEVRCPRGPAAPEEKGGPPSHFLGPVSRVIAHFARVQLSLLFRIFRKRPIFRCLNKY